MSKALVVGNGKSRLAIDIAAIRKNYVLYACNAFYEEMIPDYLVYGDKLITSEIVASGVKVTRPEPEAFGEPLWESAGGFALHAACHHGHDPIYLLGFDGGPNKNNVYYGRAFREKYNPDRPASLCNWKVGFQRIRKKFRDRTIIQVSDEDTYLEGVFPRIPISEFI